MIPKPMWLKKYAFFILFYFLALLPASGKEPSGGLPRLIFFHATGCHDCLKVRSELMPRLEREFKGKVEIEYLDIADIDNYKILLGLKQRFGITGTLHLPVVFINGQLISGVAQVEKSLESLIETALSAPSPGTWLTGPVDLVSLFLSFTPLAVIGAGLIDGINPCAFAVIIFFISFLALQGYKKRELGIIGFFFILAVFLAYLLIGLGLFGFLFRLKGFWLVARAINLSIGLFSLLLGSLALYDFFKFKKTGSSEGQLLQLPPALKNRIHSVIGVRFRKPLDAESAPSFTAVARLALGTFVTGFLVAVLEAVCTGQVYLPTIIFVMKTSSLKIQALGYLLLYNLMFVLPLCAVFLGAMLGTTSQELSKVFKRYFPAVKLAMVLLFFGLGIYLVWRA